jgi:hypothetical protein
LPTIAHDDALQAWLRIHRAPGIGIHAVLRLLAAFGSLQDVLAASPAALRSAGLGEAACQALANNRELDVQTTRRFCCMPPATSISCSTLSWLSSAVATPRPADATTPIASLVISPPPDWASPAASPSASTAQRMKAH